MPFLKDLQECQDIVPLYVEILELEVGLVRDTAIVDFFRHRNLRKMIALAYRTC
jgi:hypothetical protein